MKKTLDVQEMMNDLRTGMPDTVLMKKYNLSPDSLQRLLKKLERLGLVGVISARDFVRDIRLGMSDIELMNKYKLSAKGMESIHQQMESAGISVDMERLGGRGSKNFVRISEVVRDIRSGLTRQELMAKYHLTSRGLSWICMNLISSGAISRQEIYGKPHSRIREQASFMVRKSQRHNVNFYVPIYAASEPDVVGSIRDVSEHGLGTRGIKAEVGETKTLCIPGDSFGELGRAVLDGRCVWTGKDSNGLYLSGFEISEISNQSMQELQLLVKLTTLGWSD